MINHLCMHYYIIGKVQGVFFRASTKIQADQLGITGWVRNLPDGSVEVLACGHQDSVQQLHTWLKHGPDLAVVNQLIDEELLYTDHVDFKVI